MKNLPTDLGKVYNNTAGAFRAAKRTWQIFVPIPLRRFTSLLYDIFTFKTRPAELLMNDSAHFQGCLRSCIGEFTFQEAFDRTGRILNITGKVTHDSCDGVPHDVRLRIVWQPWCPGSQGAKCQVRQALCDVLPHHHR